VTAQAQTNHFSAENGKRIAIISCCGNIKCSRAFSSSRGRNSSLAVSTNKNTQAVRKEVRIKIMEILGKLFQWKRPQVTSASTATVSQGEDNVPASTTAALQGEKTHNCCKTRILILRNENMVSRNNCWWRRVFLWGGGDDNIASGH
jgi:hypothetical protein